MWLVDRLRQRSEHQLKQVFLALDDDRSGFITAKEFGHFMKKGEKLGTFEDEMNGSSQEQLAAASLHYTPTLWDNGMTPDAISMPWAALPAHFGLDTVEVRLIRPPLSLTAARDDGSRMCLRVRDRS